MQNTSLGVFRGDDVLPYRWPFASPGDIHFWIYDDFIDNGILGLHLNQYSQRFCGAFMLVPFIYDMRQRVTCKGTSEEHVKQKKAGVRLCSAEKDLTKVNSTVVFFYVLWVEWSLNCCKFQVCNNYFLFSKKLLRETRVNLITCWLFKQNPYARNFRSYVWPLKNCEMRNFGANTTTLVKTSWDTWGN